MYPTFENEQVAQQFVRQFFGPKEAQTEQMIELAKQRPETGPWMWELMQSWSETPTSWILKTQIAKYCREFEQGVEWMEQLLETQTLTPEQWLEAQQLRLYCYEYDYEFDMAQVVIDELIAAGYEAKVCLNQAYLLYKVHQLPAAIAYLQAYLPSAPAEQVAMVESAIAKYEKYVAKGTVYRPAYQKGDKSLTKLTYTSRELPLSPRPTHETAMSIRMLSSSSKANAALLHVDGNYYLIDCGLTKTKLQAVLAQNGLRVNDLAGVFITHDHSDHMRALPFLSEQDVPVYLDATTAAQVQQKAEFMRNGKSDALIVFTSEQLEFAGMNVTVIETSHDTEHSCGFQFTYKDQVLTYLTDLGEVDATVLRKASGATTYVLESNYDEAMLEATQRPIWIKNRIRSEKGHLSNQASAKALKQLRDEQTKNIILAHLSEEANTPELAETSFYAVNEEYAQNFVIASASEQGEWYEV